MPKVTIKLFNFVCGQIFPQFSTYSILERFYLLNNCVHIRIILEEYLDGEISPFSVVWTQFTQKTQ